MVTTRFMFEVFGEQTVIERYKSTKPHSLPTDFSNLTSGFTEWIDVNPIVDFRLIEHCSYGIHLTVYCTEVDVSTALCLTTEPLISVGTQHSNPDLSYPNLSEIP